MDSILDRPHHSPQCLDHAQVRYCWQGYIQIRFTLTIPYSDESEPSWLEPELELKDFWLGSALLVTFFTSARNQNSAENELKFDSQLKTYF